MTLLGVVLLIWICGLLIQSRTALKWPQTKGHVVSSSLTINHLFNFIKLNADPVRWYGTDVQYEYTVDGGLYISNRVAVSDFKSRNPRAALAMMNKYRHYQDVIVHYNPDDPLQAILEPENMGDIFIPAMVGVLLVILGFFTLYDQSVEVNTRGRDNYLKEGNIYQNLGNFNEALNEYSKFIEISPYLTAGYINRGNVYIDLEQWDLAITDFNKAISIDPVNAFIYFSRGNAYLGNKEYTKAWADMQKAIDMGFNVRPQILEKIKKGLQ